MTGILRRVGDTSSDDARAGAVSGGSGRRHSTSALARVQKGVKTLSYAVDIADGERLVEFPFDLPKEERAEYREHAKKHLRCVVPDCRGPLNPHFREGTRERPRRPGFQHLSGTAHTNVPEGLLHRMAKIMVARWAQAQHPDFVVTMEKTTPDGPRRPDVTVVGKSGHRVYIEVQYSGLEVPVWEERQADLTRDGSTAVWLLGHQGPHFRLTERGNLAVGPLVQAMCEAGVIPLWVDPLRQEIITAWVRDDEFGPVAPGRASAADRWDFLPMAQCTLTRDGIMTPDLTTLMEAEARRRPVIAQREAEARAREELRRKEAVERLRAMAERRREAAELAERRRQEAAELEEQRRQEAAELERVRAARVRAWEESVEFHWVLDRHDGRMPAFISESAPPHDQHLADLLGLSRQHWKAVVYETVVAAGEITWDALLEGLARGRARRTYGDGLKALRQVLRRMERAGVLELGHAADERWKIETIRTPAPRAAPEPAPEPQSESAGTTSEGASVVPQAAPQDSPGLLEPGMSAGPEAPQVDQSPTLSALAGSTPRPRGLSDEATPTSPSFWTKVARRLGLSSS